MSAGICKQWGYRHYLPFPAKAEGYLLLRLGSYLRVCWRCWRGHRCGICFWTNLSTSPLLVMTFPWLWDEQGCYTEYGGRVTPNVPAVFTLLAARLVLKFQVILHKLYGKIICKRYLNICTKRLRKYFPLAPRLTPPARLRLTPEISSSFPHLSRRS